MENFFALLQKNVLDRQVWAARQELRIAIVTWIEHGFVGDESGGVAEQGGGQAQTLFHAQGESADSLVGDGGQTDQAEDLVDAGGGDGADVGRCAQMAACGAHGVHGDEGADGAPAA
ncbi:hypothetical protein QF026_005640 [Streptomyces aurantiacus]|nr:hypothetical protein [Streptomyces aurantiacus]MDQ0777174.1 hypothetical protein [Streptomyces aurantiacus]